MVSIRLAVLAATLAAGCGTILEPAPEANRVAKWSAFAVAGNVRLTARAQAWQGMPPDLHEQVTPMLVTIANHGARPIRVAHESFRLVATDGRVYAARAPHTIEAIVPVTLDDLGDPPAGSVFWAHPGYWKAPGPRTRWVRLPTLDMLHRALPEGVLEPGGEITGFVYFERLPPARGGVELRARFPGAEGGRKTRLEIPFLAI